MIQQFSKSTFMSYSKVELEAALIAARLLKAIVQETKMPVTNISLWSHAATVLKYIKNREAQIEKYVFRHTYKIKSSQTLKLGTILKVCINLIPNA